MQWQPNIRTEGDKQYVFCTWRRKFVRLTPEEWVRQHFLHLLVEDFAYPSPLIAVEMPLQDKRADAVVYSRSMKPLMLIEFKAETVPLTQLTLDQALVYNRRLGVPWLILANGRSTIVAHCENNNIRFINSIPPYGEIS
ncbi:MAG: type I restriction enzyme HsdR N-terminal domain-containing protein [Paludibacteraceae bacterium]|nr:type I restriction enzyme HsdR N-terminal domain-containing protein [Paludibacteraceae bacterium]